MTVLEARKIEDMSPNQLLMLGIGTLLIINYANLTECGIKLTNELLNKAYFGAEDKQPLQLLLMDRNTSEEE